MSTSNSMSLSDLRRAFLEFFAAHGHSVVPSASLVPHDDPTLLFTNAGMVPFKNVFTGLEKRPYTRAASVQKCVRAGGKHNDLDNVGYTARHHTFFEMLGNFSFGDYFKEEAIAFAWEFVIRDLGLSKDRIWVTVYPSDEEARTLWRKIAHIDDSRIVPHTDNLWAMGATGPCGFCSELFYDQGDKVKGGPPGSPEEDGDRFLEFWNLVFMQFEQVDAETRVDLPQPSIDTGMGLERIAAITQGVTDNYDTDLFRTLIEASAEAAGASSDGPHAASHRVIADHVRSSSFLIADGVLPSNEGRGYVLRRIMRRAMRHAHILGAEDPVLHNVAPTLIAEMGEPYPELVRAKALIIETLRGEELRFREMLDRGLKHLDEALERLPSGKPLPGEVAFKLYDTYGFPLDLTQDALRTRGIEVDTEGFDAAMDRQRAAARAAWSGSGEAATDEVWFGLRERVGATRFLGYDSSSAEGRVVAILVDGAEQGEVHAGAKALIVTDQTPFYGESGGQVGDQGTAFTDKGAEAIITDTQKRLGDLIVHSIEVERGTLSVGDMVHLRVDVARRDRVRANHSATHLLHEALRRVLGGHVTQKGSLVAPDKLRFDFSHMKAMTASEIAEVERLVNEFVRQNSEVATRTMAPEEAIEAGALALFGEKYGDEVRVLTMGLDDASARKGGYETGAFSVELCGGTHVPRTGDIQLLKIVSEGAVGAGVRRIEALTGEAAMRYLSDGDRRLREIADVLKVRPEEIVGRVKTLVEERRKLERDLADSKKALAISGGGGPKKDRMRSVGAIKFLADVLEGIPPKDLRGLVDEGKREIGSGVVAFVATTDGKAALAVGVTDDLTDKISAVDLVRAGVVPLGGKGGGGRPDMAQAGGPDASKAGESLSAIEARLAQSG